METPRALQALETDCAPLLRKRAPYWRPTAPACHTDVHVPAWKWEHPLTALADLTDDAGNPLGERLVDLDANAAWPTAAASVNVAHGSLTHTRRQYFDGAPGYWLVDLTGFHWDDRTRHMPSPLGTNRHRDKAWLAAPTVALLQELADAGELDELDIRDSWTCDDRVRLRKWTEWIKNTRVALSEAGQLEQLADFKISYAMAVQMMLSGDTSKIHRPDWHHAIVAQHAASHWRKHWNATRSGHGPVAMYLVDAVTYLGSDLLALQDLNPSPFRIDQTGRTYGSYKIITSKKESTTA